MHPLCRAAHVVPVLGEKTLNLRRDRDVNVLVISASGELQEKIIKVREPGWQCEMHIYNL